MTLYRQFRSQEEIDQEYDLRHSVPDATPFRNFYSASNKLAAQTLTCQAKVPYGPSLDETLDIFPVKKPGAPVLVFIHGGYWRSKQSHDYHFVALGPQREGLLTVVVNYSLCPKVRLDEISRQCRAALVWIRTNIANYGGDPEALVVVGHSAGGQQAAQLLSTPWQEDYGISQPIRGAMAISGLFDLRPLQYSFLQPKLMLDSVTIQRESPLFQLPKSAPHLTISVGDEEPAEFLRQSKDYYQAWREHSLPGAYFEQEANHYTAINGFTQAGSRLMEEVLALFEA
ncbi:MAG: alpha/beta hydrolase [Planctomycetota bacterium]|nr:alpha/beta hydrolase [Planctomycetota bacterium]